MRYSCVSGTTSLDSEFLTYSFAFCILHVLLRLVSYYDYDTRITEVFVQGHDVTLSKTKYSV